MKNIAIGIEGEVGSGKTSLCRELLKLIPNSIILHGGNLYRGIVYAIAKSGLDIKKLLSTNNASEKIFDIKNMMEMLKVTLKIENNESVVYVNGIEIDEDNLQSTENSLLVSKVALNADNSKFYSFAKTLIEQYKKEYNLIISGRDIVRIYPEVDYHFFITADLDTRVDRKLNQYTNEEITREELKKEIQERDNLQQKSGFYDKSEKTITLDVTECKSAEESAKKVLKYINL